MFSYIDIIAICLYNTCDESYDTIILNYVCGDTHMYLKCIVTLVYIYMHMCICVYIHVCICAYVYIYTCVHMCMCAYVHMYIGVDVCVCVC